MAIDVTTLALAKAYAKSLLESGSGTAGKNVTIESIVAIDGGNRITFGYTDDNGVAQTKTLDVMDGKDGKDGTSVTHSWDGTILTVVSASGTSSADLKGEKGDKGDKGDTGAAGKDGVNGTNGSKGDTGEKGDKGDTGETGASIASISLVKDDTGSIVSGTATLTDDTVIEIAITTA